jgi:nucleoside-diphosphate-sugar epimerase
MKIVIPGGTGQAGKILCRAFASTNDEVVVLSRNTRAECSCRCVKWDGESVGDWVFPKPSLECRIHARPAARLGYNDWCSVLTLDAGSRRVLYEDRDRIDSEEPACCAFATASTRV